MLALSSICIVYLKFVQYRCHVVLFPGVYIHLVLIHDIYIYWKQDVYFFTVFYSLYYSQDVCLLHMKYTMKLYIYELLGEGRL